MLEDPIKGTLCISRNSRSFRCVSSVDNDVSFVFKRAYSTDGEESQRAPSDRTMSEYMIANERAAASVVGPETRHKDRHKAGVSRQSNYDTEGSDIYVTSAAYRAPSEMR